MSKVFTALAVSVDGFITGRDPGRGRPLGDGGTLFAWYDDPANSAYFNALADRVGAVVTGRTTYDDCDGFEGGSPHRTAPIVVASHRPQPPEYADSDKQSFADTIEGAVERARELAADKDVGLQGGVTLASAIDAGLVDEVILHQVPVLLGAGRPFFAPLAEQVRLTLLDIVQGSSVTHLHYGIENRGAR